MLDFIYYPVSGILWFWHKVFSLVSGAPDSGVVWALSVVFLVFTLRAILFKPFVKQVRTQLVMQKLQPQIKALQKKYAGDNQKLAAEMAKLQKEHDYSPLLGCLPMLIQAPVFIGLYHVLRSFNRTGAATHVPFLSPTEPMSIADNANTANYFFSASDVQSFLDAKLFGAPLSAMISSPAAQLEAFGDVTRLSIVLVAVPLMIFAAVATHFTSRASIARQVDTGTVNPQTAIMNKLALWVFPVGVVAFGAFVPVAILIYFVSNNCWTFAQQHFVYGRIAAEQREADVQIPPGASTAPAPGAKPTKAKRKS
ncbi:membrane protein insertase YidC [Rhodococcus sp. MS16]|uniref:membrane protein insertase YidC n=1 Tax=Rhodococcus sp. MS16 TaxID=2579941 RepID=UPI001561B61C|nr:membrane protein insertase YidC [Rhodococcus sp. MS16]NRI65195.1 membrane protein insertase YidC [Rhodococcus sp. MS16]